MIKVVVGVSFVAVIFGIGYLFGQRKERKRNVQQKSEQHMVHLSPDMVRCVLDYGSNQDLIAFELVCKSWRRRVRSLVKARQLNGSLKKPVEPPSELRIALGRVFQPMEEIKHPNKWDLTVRVLGSVTEVVLEESARHAINKWLTPTKETDKKQETKQASKTVAATTPDKSKSKQTSSQPPDRDRDRDDDEPGDDDRDKLELEDQRQMIWYNE